MGKVIDYLFMAVISVFVIVMFYGVNRFIKATNACSEKNGILMKSPGGWVCVDRQVITWRKA